MKLLPLAEGRFVRVFGQLAGEAYPSIELPRSECGRSRNEVSFQSVCRRGSPQARSSEGEHFPDTEGVGGSSPPVPIAA